MASSGWKLWPFRKGASSPPVNFLHLARTNIERICVLESHKEPLNPHQCRHMSSKLERAMRSIERVLDSVDDIGLVSSSAALESFYRVSEKAMQLVENCCKDDWCKEAAFQIQNEEAFKEILLDASLCYNTICDIVENMNRNKESLCGDLRESSLFDLSGAAEEVSKDGVALHEILEGLVNDESASKCDLQSQLLANYLLGRVNHALQHSDDEDFDVRSLNQWSDGNCPVREWGEKESFLGGGVSKTTWLGVPCAKKHFQDDAQEFEWLAEAKILASLNHPNIVKFLYCNKCGAEHTSSHFIAMEQMDTSLGSFIKSLKEEGAKLPLFSALDIILQIAHGMCYLHEHGIAHRDLKTSNVVVRKIAASQLEYHLEVKLVDFGISKTKLRDRSNTITRPKMGTTLYMPPEAFSHGRANWFKADVYSFSVMCSVILSGNEPFQDVKRKDIFDAVCSGKRPVLPRDIPEELASVVREGWATDRNSRPSFFDICTRLEKLRHRLLRDRTLGSNMKQEKPPDCSDLFIENMLKRRAEAREHARSRAPVQVAVASIEDEEWLDGDQIQGGKQHLHIDPTQRMREAQSKLPPPLSESENIENNRVLVFENSYRSSRGCESHKIDEDNPFEVFHQPIPKNYTGNSVRLDHRQKHVHTPSGVTSTAAEVRDSDITSVLGRRRDGYSALNALEAVAEERPLGKRLSFREQGSSSNSSVPPLVGEIPRADANSTLGSSPVPTIDPSAPPNFVSDIPSDQKREKDHFYFKAVGVQFVRPRSTECVEELRSLNSRHGLFGTSRILILERFFDVSSTFLQRSRRP